MSITKEEVAEAVREWCRAWDTHDVITILAMEAQASGFGFRPFARRDQAAVGERGYSQMLERFFSEMEYFHLRLEDLQTSVIGDVGCAWGGTLKSFRRRGAHPNERGCVLPRFSRKEHTAGRCCCTTAISSLSAMMGATPDHSPSCHLLWPERNAGATIFAVVPATSGHPNRRITTA